MRKNFFCSERFKRCWPPISFCTITILLLVIMLLVFVILAIYFLPVEYWAAITAIGTISAVIVALWFGLDEKINAARQRKDLTKFCLGVAENDLVAIQESLSLTVGKIKKLPYNLTVKALQEKEFQCYVKRTIDSVLSRLRGVRFESYKSIEKWLPTIDAEIGFALVQLNLRVTYFEKRIESFFFPIIDYEHEEQLSKGLVVDCFIQVLIEMSRINKKLLMVRKTDCAVHQESKIKLIIDEFQSNASLTEN